MRLSLILTFIFLLIIIIPSVQNSIPLDIKFFFWELQTSLTALMFFSALSGAVVVALFTLPRLTRKHFKAKKLNKELFELKMKTSGLEKQEKEKAEVK